MNQLVTDLRHLEPLQLRRLCQDFQHICVVAVLVVALKSAPLRVRIGLAPLVVALVDGSTLLPKYAGVAAVLFAIWPEWVYMPIEWSLIPAFLYGCKDWQAYASSTLVIFWMGVYACFSVVLRRWTGWLDRYCITAYYSIPVCVYAIWHFVHLGHEELSFYNLYSHGLSVIILTLLVAWATTAPAQT